MERDKAKQSSKELDSERTERNIDEHIRKYQETNDIDEKKKYLRKHYRSYYNREGCILIFDLVDSTKTKFKIKEGAWVVNFNEDVKID